MRFFLPDAVVILEIGTIAEFCFEIFMFQDYTLTALLTLNSIELDKNF